MDGIEQKHISETTKIRVFGTSMSSWAKQEGHKKVGIYRKPTTFQLHQGPRLEIVFSQGKFTHETHFAGIKLYIQMFGIHP